MPLEIQLIIKEKTIFILLYVMALIVVIFIYIMKVEPKIYLKNIQMFLFLIITLSLIFLQ
jgi:hypothetical protein